jgi:hypothetical protein
MARRKQVLKQFSTSSIWRRKRVFLTLNVIKVPHLIYTSLTFFLADRLPIQLGSFISGKVYNGKLKSEHEIADYSCIAFIDVWKGKEMKRGNSYLVSELARERISPQVDEREIIEHGGGEYGCPGCSAISSTQARILHHHVLRPSTSSYHQGSRE